jgi:hypothetical protein
MNNYYHPIAFHCFLVIDNVVLDTVFFVYCLVVLCDPSP